MILTLDFCSRPGVDANPQDCGTETRIQCLMLSRKVPRWQDQATTLAASQHHLVGVFSAVLFSFVLVFSSQMRCKQRYRKEACLTVSLHLGFHFHSTDLTRFHGDGDSRDAPVSKISVLYILRGRQIWWNVLIVFGFLL